MWKGFLKFSGLLVVTSVAITAGSATSTAIQLHDELSYSGSGQRSIKLVDEVAGPFDIDIPPLDGEVSFGLFWEVPAIVEIKPQADFDLTAPEGLVEGEPVPVVLKLVSKDGSVNEFKLRVENNLVVALDHDVDEDGTSCPGFPADEAHNDDECFSVNISQALGAGEVVVFDESMVAAYLNGSNTFGDEKELLTIPVCKFLIGVDICSLAVNGHVGAKLEASGVAEPGYHMDRSVTIGSVEGQQTTLNFTSPDEMVDTVTMTCGGAPGSTVMYNLTDVSYDARLTRFSVGLSFDLEAGPFDERILDISDAVNLLDLFGGPIDVFASADNLQRPLGTYQAEQTPPTIGAVAATPPSSSEGQAVKFEATATDNCPGALTYTWDFSDGGTAFGNGAFHSFDDNGTYSYKLTVCDRRGNCSSTTGNYVVGNLPPIANAGPPAIDAWGRPIPFNGQAVDPGAGDQSTLSYEWDFGDNSPKGHAKDVTHAYSTPGAYTATLKVCDKDLACDTAIREITIRKRDTSTGYLGSNAWTFDTQTHLSASLVDEFGQMVNGRQVQFSIDGSPTTDANTNSAGIADRAHQVSQTAGVHAVAAAFAGDWLYEASSSNQSAVVVVKATNVVYTGALAGGPNKTITLSAVLRDSEGKPLNGRTISFLLGSQAASAITDLNGVATTTLKLTQKNGSYSLTATYTPSGADTIMYSGSGSSNTFKLQAK